MKTITRLDGWCDEHRYSFSRLYWGVAWASCLLAFWAVWFSLPAFSFSFGAFLLSSKSVRGAEQT